jgi:hypothetical protein
VGHLGFAGREGEEMTTRFEVGDQVRQKLPTKPYQDTVNTQVGTVVAVSQGDYDGLWPVAVIFPDNGFNELPWPFRTSELELVSILAEEEK